MVRFFRNFIVFIIFLSGGLLIGLYSVQRSLLYFPDPQLLSPSRAGVPGMKPVMITTDDELKLTSWYQPAQGEALTVVSFHGNAGNISHRGVKVRKFIQAGYGVLLAEYRGYGGNPGSPTEDDLINDGRAALKFLEAQGIALKKIVLYGESLGTGVAIALAKEFSVAGLVLEAPYSSMVDAASYHYPFFPVKWLLIDSFDSAKRAASISLPSLLIHGDRDNIIPMELGLKLAKRFKRQPQIHVVKGGGHNNLLEMGLSETILKFLSRLSQKNKK